MTVTVTTTMTMTMTIVLVAMDVRVSSPIPKAGARASLCPGISLRASTSIRHRQVRL